MLGAALAAQARGHHIFPVARDRKVPHSLAGQWGQTATNDINRIIHFWTQVDSHANIGIACKPSHLLVVDLDVAKADWNLVGTDWAYLHQGYGPRVSGEDAWDEMVHKMVQGDDDDEDWSATYQVRTGSGGIHLYYRWPTHWPKISQASPIKGLVDVRGNGGDWGGYVLGEGSITGNETQKDGSVKLGGLYSAIETGFPVALTPRWIRRLVAEKPRVDRPRAVRQPGLLFTWDGLARSVRTAGEGNRNNTLLWAARSMCSDGAPEHEAQDILGAAARQAGLSDFEARQTIASAYRLQQHKDG